MIGQPWYLNSRFGWLPSLQQMADALRMDVGQRPVELATLDDFVIDPEGDPAAREPQPKTVVPAAWHPFAISMRQGFGMICIVGLLAGLIPFLVNWSVAGQAGVALPLAQKVRLYDATVDALTRGRDATPNGAQIFYGPNAGPADETEAALDALNGNTLDQTTREIAKLSPIWPGWAVAGLSSLGEWINWPLRLLTIWLVYGTLVLLVCHWLGAGTTIQNYLAATSYAALPILLYALTPVPYLGLLAALIGTLGAIIVYFVTARTVTGLNMAQTFLAMVAPLGLAFVLGMILFGLLAISVAGGVSTYFG